MLNLKPIAILLLALTLLPLGPTSASTEEETRPDLMSFAQGVLPVSIKTEGLLKVDMTAAIAVIDGNPIGFGATAKPGGAADVVEILYALPAPTRFERFAIPNVLETPSAFQTFFQYVEVLGSASGPEDGFVPLASGELSIHAEKSMITELTMADATSEVLWIKLRLWGGTEVVHEKTFFEFSELIGNGTQQSAALSDGFSGVWKGRGVKIEMAQEGASVTGCYDTDSTLAGTVEGRVLRALGHNPAGIQSQFILITNDEGALRGLQSTNGGPFKPYDGEMSNKAPVCLPSEPAVVGCGAILHGIGFDYDSDVIRSSSTTLIEALYQGLSVETDVSIVITGHSSSEGSAAYNRDLSQRRAQSVVDALISLGLPADQLSASGRGEDEPIASNEDEAGRSLNRRVEVQCTG